MQLFRPLCSDARLPRFLYYHIYITLDAICVCIFFLIEGIVISIHVEL